MDFAKIDVEVRTKTGKGNARKSRAAGRVPAILYGRKEEPVALALDPNALVRSMDKEKRRNTVFSLNVSNNGKTEQVTVMIKEAQVHPVTRAIEHIDFVRVTMDQEVKVVVPVVLKGSPAGVILGGTLHQSVHQLRLAARPDAIPARIEVDVSSMEIGAVIHVGDLKLGEGQRALLHAEDAIASVQAPVAETATPAAEAAPAAAAAAPAAEKK